MLSFSFPFIYLPKQPKQTSFTLFFLTPPPHFHFTPPFTSMSPAAAADVLRQVTTGELHVLAVDDSHVDRKVIERLLKITSCKVTVVDSGTRALQYLGLDGDTSSIGIDVKVNMIMTDYSMPGMTGYELLKRIKESSLLREIPVVVMSSENILTRIDRKQKEKETTASLRQQHFSSEHPIFLGNDNFSPATTLLHAVADACVYVG